MTSPWKWALLLDGILITKIEDGPEKLLFRKVFSLSPTPPPPEKIKQIPSQTPLHPQEVLWIVKCPSESGGLASASGSARESRVTTQSCDFPNGIYSAFFFFLEWNVIPPTPSHFWAWLSCGITDTLGFLFRAQKSFTFYFPFFHEYSSNPLTWHVRPFRTAPQLSLQLPSPPVSPLCLLSTRDFSPVCKLRWPWKQPWCPLQLPPGKLVLILQAFFHIPYEAFPGSWKGSPVLPEFIRPHI